jgi:hypothetical protein
MKETPYDVACKRARRGYRWLKAKGPKYGLDVGNIDLGLIDLSSNTFCVLAQSTVLHRSFRQMADEIWPGPSFIRNFWLCRYGFLLQYGLFGSDDRKGVTLQLQRTAWINVIAADRALREAVDG